MGTWECISSALPMLRLAIPKYFWVYIKYCRLQLCAVRTWHVLLLGRFVMSFLLMAATLLIAKLIHRETRQFALAVGYMILLGFFPFVVQYSNYIRADTFVAFSAFWPSIGLFLSECGRFTSRRCFRAAIACKFSTWPSDFAGVSRI